MSIEEMYQDYLNQTCISASSSHDDSHFDWGRDYNDHSDWGRDYDDHTDCSIDDPLGTRWDVTYFDCFHSDDHVDEDHDDSHTDESHDDSHTDWD